LASSFVSMKLKLVVAALVATALIIGFLVGRLQAKCSWDGDLKRLQQTTEAERAERAAAGYLKQIEASAADRAVADFSEAAGILLALRSGNTNEAIETLERDLDINIQVIGGAIEDVPAGERNPKYVARIKWLQDYRSSHPRTTGSHEDDKWVAHVLSLVTTNHQ
jgi:hypothetical protein